jgi:hypothetical protein
VAQRTHGLPLRTVQEQLLEHFGFRRVTQKRDALAEQLRGKNLRVVVAGGPRRGKSTLAKKLAGPGVKYHHGEELVGVEWSAGSELASRWFDEPGPFVCENVAMARALRKWLARNPSGKPADVVVHLAEAVTASTPGQETMARGCATVWAEIKTDLLLRGVQVIES